MKKDISIEDLLVWAYRTERIDLVRKDRGHLPPPLITSSGLALYSLLGVSMIDGGGFAGASFGGAIDGDASEAQRVDDAVMALPDYWIERKGDGDLSIWSRPEVEACGLTAVETVNGTFLAGDGAQTRVHRVSTAVTVILCARDSRQPDFYPEWRRPRGRPKNESWFDDVELARVEYHLWREALISLRQDLLGAGFDLSPALPLESPWRRVESVSCSPVMSSPMPALAHPID